MNSRLRLLAIERFFLKEKKLRMKTIQKKLLLQSERYKVIVYIY